MKTLAESFTLLSRYGDEYMDESPLMGEPGSFILSRTGDADRGVASKKQQQAPTTASAPIRVATPQTKVDTPGKTSEKGVSAAEEPKLRKKKSKPGN
jgi:mediator of RNA polymerase II transcription subunit 6